MTNDFLMRCVSSGILSLDEIMGADEVSVMKKILDGVHPYKIGRSSDGRYYTYVADESGRRQIRKPSLNKLYDFLIDFYGLSGDGMTFGDLFRDWVSYKRQFIAACNKKKGLSPSTIRRYERDYERCVRGSALESMPLSSLSSVVLESELSEIIKKKKLSEKAASNLLGYICQALQYGARSGQIKCDPSLSMDRRLVLSVCAPPVVPEDCDRVLSREEYRSLLVAVHNQQERHPFYAPNYAVELDMFTGMRVGELAALRWRCVSDVFLYVDESEHRLDYSDRPSELVIGEPKNGKHRRVPMTAEMRDLFDRVRAVSPSTGPDDFVFVSSDGRRCTGHDIGCAAARRGREAGISGTVSIHRIRRTVSSLLREVLPPDSVARVLGHSPRVNSEFYAYDVVGDAAARDALGGLVSGLSSSVIKFGCVDGIKKVQEA